VPTIAEAGVPGYEATIWLGVMAPAGTPQEIVDKLNAEINKIINRPDVKEAWAKQGAVPMVMSPAEFDKYLRADIEKWAHVVKVSGAIPYGQSGSRPPCWWRWSWSPSCGRG
jgi:tripartite-type tricarboxylate transporter receptor subunit TctC